MQKMTKKYVKIGRPFTGRSRKPVHRKKVVKRVVLSEWQEAHIKYLEKTKHPPVY